MSTARRTLFAALSLVCVVWSFAALYAQKIRLEHGNLIEQIRGEGSLPDMKVIDAAITSYNHAIDILPCNIPLHEDLALLLALRTDSVMQSPDINAEADALDTVHGALTNLLACSPTNGKAWLDLAMINVYREGFTKRSARAYIMSAKVAPGESWLAEKRLIFILPFVQLLDADGQRTITRDLATLEVAHSNRTDAVIAAAQVSSKAELLGLLGQPSATRAP